MVRRGADRQRIIGEQARQPVQVARVDTALQPGQDRAGRLVRLGSILRDSEGCRTAP
jgi:hypothetical protein